MVAAGLVEVGRHSVFSRSIGHGVVGFSFEP
jgi:hypothetical protein